MKSKTIRALVVIIGVAFVIAIVAALVPLHLKRTSLIFSSNLPEWVKYLIL